MANKTLNTRIVIRNDTAQNWAAANPVLRKGEIGIVFDPQAGAANAVTNFKIGDGVLAWNSLPLMITEYDPSSLVQRIAALESELPVGDFDSTNTVKAALNAVNARVDGLATRMTATEAATAVAQATANAAASQASANLTAINTLNGGAAVTGSVANTVAAAIDALDLGNTYEAKGAAAQALADAKTYVDGKGYVTAGIVAGYATEGYVDAIESSLDSRIDALEGNHFEVVNVLPETGKVNTIYLVPDANVGYKEWLYVNNFWEEIGDTNIDLSNYYTKTEIDNKGYVTAGIVSGYATEGYAQAQASAALAAAQTYADSVGTATLASANAAITAAVAAEVTRADAAYLANTDVLILDCGNASSNYSAS